jgi:prepilin-type processing-associated H-X9-DG protein
MVALVEQGLARQTEVARAFKCDVRTVRRNQRRFEDEGLYGLGRLSGYPRGRSRVAATREKNVNEWKTGGVPNRDIGRRLGITENAVRKYVRRLGWKDNGAEQLGLPFTTAHPNLSGITKVDPGVSTGPAENTDKSGVPAADPNLSGLDATSVGGLEPKSLDSDPGNRSFDRVLAYMGLMDDAPPVFRNGTKVSGAGVLLAVSAIVRSGVLDEARKVYGSIGPAFYGLRTTILTLILMALLRIKRPEGLKERSPVELGRLIGLDRAPEVKTMRRKLARLAACNRGVEFGRALAKLRVAAHGQAMGFLYVDGHVRVYHGKQNIPKTHVAQSRLCMPATTDYWVNDAKGEPLLVLTVEAHRGLVKILPEILEEVRRLVGERRVTIVFDRGGWSPKLFAKLIKEGFDVLTYRKGSFRRVPASRFKVCETKKDGKKVSYNLADLGVKLKNGLRMRQVTQMSESGHQTPIVTSRRDLSAIDVAYRMFERWRQENFFKYLGEEFALDALVDYEVEPADPEREAPNPVYKGLKAKSKKATAELEQLMAQYGLEALENLEQARKTMRGFKIANASIARALETAMKRVDNLNRRCDATPKRVPVKAITEGVVVKLSVERKHLTNLIKMVAYQAEGELLRILKPHYRRAEDEGRTLIQNALAAAGDIEVTKDDLRVSLEPLSSPHRTRALAALCDAVNTEAVRFPATKLRLHFDVKGHIKTGNDFEKQPIKPQNRTS